MAGKLRQGSRAAGRWLVPSLFAAGVGTVVAGAVEARPALADGDVLSAAATVGFIALVALPVLIAGSALARGLWAAWAPRVLARRVVDDHGAAPVLAAWLLALALAGLALAWAAFQGIWALSNHTAFKPITVGFVEPAIVVAAAVGLALAIGPAVRLFAYLFGQLEAEWRRARGGRPLLTPWRIAWAVVALAAAAVELIWRFGIKPKIGPFDTAVFDAPLAGIAAWGVAHAVVGALPRRTLAIAAAASVALAALAIGSAGYALESEPALTLAIWGDRPVAGFAIDELFDLDDIRAGMSLAEFQPVEKPDSPHPDIILVTIDTVRADRTPPYNPAGADMPVLREIGQLGTVFEWAFSPSNVTRRSIPSLIIGLEANRVHGRVVGWALRVDPRHVMLPERLAAGGYETAGFMCCDGFWGDKFHTGLQRGLEHLEIESNGRELARKARVWIEERERSHPTKPLFVWMHILEPHNWTVASGEGRTDAERRQFYDRSLSASDAMLGELMNAFSHRAPAKAPIVIVTADHGEGLGEHGHPYHSTDLYDSQTHVPLVIAGPGIKPARVAETVSLVDLVPTVLELAGFVPPAGPSLDGHSIADLATGRRTGNADGGTAFAAMVQDRSNPGGIEMMVRGRWKLIENENGGSELYDTRSDPDEHFNLFTQKTAIATELRRMLDQKRAAGDESPFD